MESCLEEAISLLGPNAGFQFLDSISDRDIKRLVRLGHTQFVPALRAGDSGKVTIFARPSRDFNRALTALRAGDREGFWRHIKIPDPDSDGRGSADK